MWFLVYGSRLINQALGCWACISRYPGGTRSVAELGVLSTSSGGAGDVPCLAGAGRGRGAPMPLRLQRVCGFFAVPFWQGRQLSVRFSRTSAGCHSIAAFTSFRQGYTTHLMFSSLTPAWCYLIRCCVSSLEARENPSLAILAIFKASRMSECSCCTGPPCLVIVPDMLRPYKNWVTATRVRFGCYLNHIRLRSLLAGLKSPIQPVPETFIIKFFCHNPRTDNIVRFNLADSVDRCLRRPWRSPVTGSDQLVT